MSAPDRSAGERPDRRFTHNWHVAINKTIADVGRESRWMYDAKDMADEVPRLTYLFGLERRGELPTQHVQCSRSEPVPILEEFTTCCLGVRCSECPELAGIEASPDLSDEQKDLAKAWTCAAHIVSQGGDKQNEGFVLTVSDRMYWDNVYESLAHDPEDFR